MTEEKKTESKERRRTKAIASYVPKERTPAVAWLRYSCEPAYVCDMTDEDGSPTKFAEEMMIVAIRTNAELRHDLTKIYKTNGWLDMTPDEALSIIDAQFDLVRMMAKKPGRDLTEFAIDVHTELGRNMPIIISPCAVRRRVVSAGLRFVPDENAPLPREEILRESERASENGDSLIQRNGIIVRGWLEFDPFEVDLLYLESVRKKSFLERMAEGR